MKTIDGLTLTEAYEDKVKNLEYVSEICSKYQDALYRIDVALTAPEAMLPKNRLKTIYDIVQEVIQGR